jgi:hypothetical protein
MDYRVVWVHGIGPTLVGYSDSWTQTYNQYLKFPVSDFIEVLWADVYSSTMSEDNVEMNKITMPLATQQQLLEAQVSKALTTVLLARATAQVQNAALLGEWSQFTNKIATGQALLPPWVVNSDAYATRSKRR